MSWDYTVSAIPGDSQVVAIHDLFTIFSVDDWDNVTPPGNPASIDVPDDEHPPGLIALCNKTGALLVVSVSQKSIAAVWIAALRESMRKQVVSDDKIAEPLKVGAL